VYATDTDCPVVGDDPRVLVAENFVEVYRGIDTEDSIRTRQVGIQGRASAKARMGLPVIFALQPASETRVVILDTTDGGRLKGDLELCPDGPEKALDFSSSFRDSGTRMYEGNAQGVQDAVCLIGDKSGSMIGI